MSNTQSCPRCFDWPCGCSAAPPPDPALVEEFKRLRDLVEAEEIKQRGEKMTTDPRLLSDETLAAWEADATPDMCNQHSVVAAERIRALLDHVAAQAEQVALVPQLQHAVNGNANMVVALRERAKTAEAECRQAWSEVRDWNDAHREQLERAEKAEAERDINGRLADDWRAEAFREKARADAAVQREADLRAKITALADEWGHAEDDEGMFCDEAADALRAITESGATHD